MSPIWRSFELVSSGFALECMWRSLIGEEFSVCRPAFLFARSERAQLYPCPAQCGCHHRVVEHSPTHIVAVCDCEEWDCENIPLQPEDLIYWQLNVPRLGRALAQALEIDRREDDLGIRGTLQFGCWSADAVPVILALPHEADEFRHMVAELGMRLQRRFILFTPTNRYLDVRSQELLTHARAGFFTLDANFTLLPSGLLRARQSAGVLFAAFQPQASSTASESEAQKVFRLMKSLDGGRSKRKAPLEKVFRLLVLEGRSQDAVAADCGCVKSLVSRRVDQIERMMGRSIVELRALAAQNGGMEAVTKDPRARNLYRRRLVDDTDAEEEM